MVKRLFKYEIIGFVFVCLLGTLNHFLFDWGGENVVIGAFCPVNESIWEHLKLIYFPYLIYSIFEYKKICQAQNNFWLSKYIGVNCGIFTILGIHYIVTGAIGRAFTVVDLVSFFVGVLVAFTVSYALIKNNTFSKVPKWIGLALLIIKSAEFVLFTFYPPLIPLFQDPTNATFGI